MGFYQHFYKYYDDIFPFAEEKLQFLLDQFSYLPAEASLLDIGCGTGTYTISLQENSFDVVGIDKEIEMIDHSREKAARKNMEIEPRFKIMDMQDLDVFYSPQSFSGVYSLGNVLVHLADEDEIATVIKKIYRILLTEGKLAVQIINYDRIISQGITELPTIENEEAGVKFQRRYRYDEQRNQIKFHTRLTVDNPETADENRNTKFINSENKEPETFVNSIELYPLRSQEVMDLLEEAGFSAIKLYGNFSGEEYEPEDSYHLIFTAEKA